MSAFNRPKKVPRKQLYRMIREQQQQLNNWIQVAAQTQRRMNRYSILWNLRRVGMWLRSLVPQRKEA